MLQRAFACSVGFVVLLGLVLTFSIPASATTIQGTLKLVGTITPGSSTPLIPPFGLTEISLTQPFKGQAQFSVTFLGGGSPDPAELPASLLAFDLTIGNTHWDASMPHSDVKVLVQGESLLGLEMIITDTIPHPDLSFFLPFSPGTWEAHDWDGITDHGTISGTYQVNATAVPEPTTILLVGSGLVGLWGARKKFKR